MITGPLIIGFPSSPGSLYSRGMGSPSNSSAFPNKQVLIVIVKTIMNKRKALVLIVLFFSKLQKRQVAPSLTNLTEFNLSLRKPFIYKTLHNVRKKRSYRSLNTYQILTSFY